MKPLTAPISRRDFIKRSAESSFAAAAVFPLRNAVTEPPYASTVVLVRDPDVLNSDQEINAEVLSRMLDTGVTTLTGHDSVDEAWREIRRLWKGFKPAQGRTKMGSCLAVRRGHRQCQTICGMYSGRCDP